MLLRKVVCTNLQSRSEKLATNLSLDSVFFCLDMVFPNINFSQFDYKEECRFFFCKFQLSKHIRSFSCITS